MRLPFLCCIALTVATPALASWEVIGPYTQIDPASVQPDASGFTLGMRRFDLDKAGLPAPLASTVSHVHFDCHTHLSHQVDIAYYDKRDHLIGGGKTPPSDKPMLDTAGSMPAKIEARFCPKS